MAKTAAPVWAQELRELIAKEYPQVLDYPLEWKGRHSKNAYRQLCSTGTCYYGPKRIVIRAGEKLIDQITTLIHELAHASLGIGYEHGEVWARRNMEMQVRYGFPEFAARRCTYRVTRAVAADMAVDCLERLPNGHLQYPHVNSGEYLIRVRAMAKELM